MANDAQMPDVRRWDYYPIEMPVTADGKGPATVGVDAARITYEVWDRDLLSHASYDNLPDAINEAMRLNAALPSDPASDLCASGQQVRALNRAVGDDRKAGWTLPVGVLSAIKQRVYRDDGEVVSLEAVEIIALEVERILASLTPAPQPEGMECPRCASVGGFGCYECTTPQPSETVAEAVVEGWKARAETAEAERDKAVAAAYEPHHRRTGDAEMTDTRELVDELRLIGCHANGDARCTCVIGQEAADTITAQDEQVRVLEEALRFYADISKYPAPLTGAAGELYFDCGQVARAALASGGRG